jgi:hypothetical protein
MAAWADDKEATAAMASRVGLKFILVLGVSRCASGARLTGALLSLYQGMRKMPLRLPPG